MPHMRFSRNGTMTRPPTQGSMAAMRSGKTASSGTGTATSQKCGMALTAFVAGCTLRRGQIKVAHDHLQVLPGFLLLPRIAQQKRRMVGDRQLALQRSIGPGGDARRRII